MEWAGEEEKKRKEEEEAKRKEEEKKAEEEERKKRGFVHGVEILYVKEAHCRKKATPSDWKSSNQHFHLECLCPKTHKQDFEDFRQEDNTVRFLANAKYDTILSYGAKFTYQKYVPKPDYVFDNTAPPAKIENNAAMSSSSVANP